MMWQEENLGSTVFLKMILSCWSGVILTVLKIHKLVGWLVYYVLYFLVFGTKEVIQILNIKGFF